VYLLGGLIAIYIAYIWRTFVIFSLLIGLRALRLFFFFSVVQLHIMPGRWCSKNSRRRALMAEA